MSSPGRVRTIHGQGDDVGGVHAEPGSAGADGFRHVGGGQMAVMLLHHPGIAVSEILRQHQQRHSRHGRQGSVGMPQHVKADRWIDGNRQLEWKEQGLTNAPKRDN